MVTGPDLRSADEAAQYLIRLRQLLRWLGISEADMEKAHLRCDANVSIRPKGAIISTPRPRSRTSTPSRPYATPSRPRSSARSARWRPGTASKPGRWNGTKILAALRKMRSKETEADYRYFREPDLLPIRLDSEWLSAILADLPELPLERRARFVEQYGLPEYDADILTGERSLSDYFEAA